MLNPYLLYIKLGLAVLALIVLGFFGYKVHSWHQDSLKLESAQKELEQVKATYEAAQKASEGYQSELKEIRNRPVTTGPVRLCVKPRVSATPSGPSSTVSPAGVVSGPTGTDSEVREGPDIGPALQRLIERAEQVSAQGRATQSLHMKGPR